ncbi:mRNA splicing protein SMX2 [Ascoidea rubescens DSM 1968]|uniref:Small nuclear ribonucleoprotein G n=1 Tax=Ascoidea rubescens DSM 1968 TaxID=1344418 RepID=A0A1D2VAQ8_9ASCO|nr:like-Sm ribonucleo protein [Ascoidea rubescens DSM 1968]ODV58665.1 like-Sm ribonucleo protein [Ascoidea rubescens DSM 1968]
MVSAPELKKYMDKTVSIQLNGSRKIVGILRGYDVFLNLTVDEGVEIGGYKNKEESKIQIGTAIVRGNSIVSIEVLDKI